MNFDNISNGIIDINKGTKYENLLEYYKSLTFKLIWTTESTNFQILEKKDLKKNLVNYNTNYIISDYLRPLFFGIEHDGFDTDIDNLIFQIMKLTSDDRKYIIKKTFYLIDNFYTFLERSNLNTLEYEAYNEMVFEQLKIIEQEIRNKWHIEKIVFVHRLGEVKVTESSVFIAISSRHRGDSLESVNYAINKLKEIVPIWKKEHYEDGSSWKENKEFLNLLEKTTF